MNERRHHETLLAFKPSKFQGSSVIRNGANVDSSMKARNDNSQDYELAKGVSLLRAVSEPHIRNCKRSKNLGLMDYWVVPVLPQVTT